MNYKLFAYRDLIFNSPLSEERADCLIALCHPANRILDLGCGWGELLLRMLEVNPDSHGTGIDSDGVLIERGSDAAIARGFQERVSFICSDATTASERYDLVIAMGVTHIWGTVTEALDFLKDHIEPKGKLLLGTGIWTDTTSDELKKVFGELPAVEELQNIVIKAGFTIETTEIASMEEWDAFESQWRGGLEASNDPTLIAFAAERKEEYEKGYRGILGFCYIVARLE